MEDVGRLPVVLLYDVLDPSEVEDEDKSEVENPSKLEDEDKAVYLSTSEVGDLSSED